jgi:threonine dehydrogenase-like Zn-dependent dehydrogenase
VNTKKQGDIVLRVTNTAICGSDLHLFLRGMPGMSSGDVLGHGAPCYSRCHRGARLAGDCV